MSSYSNNLLIMFYFIASLAETNRIPLDLPESESESVAGFITEYSSIYYSIVVLTEYTNIIALLLFMIIIFLFSSEILLLVLCTISLTRSTFTIITLVPFLLLLFLFLLISSPPLFTVSFILELQ